MPPRCRRGTWAGNHVVTRRTECDAPGGGATGLGNGPGAGRLMAWLGRKTEGRPGAPMLQVEALDVHYGRAHVLQGVSLTLERGVLAIVGRNGMGKTTLCNAITGLVASSGSVKLHGEEIRGLPPHRITRRGIAYVPQGRRVWPSLSVDETLRLVAPDRREVERVYAMFRAGRTQEHAGAPSSGGSADAGDRPRPVAEPGCCDGRADRGPRR